MGIDRRVRRTRAALYDALVALMRERDYETIRVHDILDRADVSRSTFYAHFRTKDELLARSLERLRDELIAAIDRVDKPSLDTVSRAVFRHIDMHRDIRASIAGRRAGEIVNQAIAAALAQAMQKVLPRARLSRLPRELAIAHISASFLCMAQWWLERRPSLSWEEAEAMYRQLVVLGLSSEWPDLVAARHCGEGICRTESGDPP